MTNDEFSLMGLVRATNNSVGCWLYKAYSRIIQLLFVIRHSSLVICTPFVADNQAEW